MAPRHRRLPLVTIVTPTLNQAAFIRATLRSVAEQDYPAIEHIVLDGGSTDGTIDILKDWTQHKILWESGSDAGQADAIAKGFSMAAGSILGWLNSDDTYLRPDAISLIVAGFASGVRAVTAGGAYIDGRGTHVRRIPVSPRITHSDLRCVDTVLQPATFFDRGLAEQFPIDRSLHFAFDWDLFIRMSGVSPFQPLDVPIAGYRIHGAGKTETGGYRRQRELLRLTVKYRGRRNPATWALAGVAGTYWLASRLPVRLERKHDHLMRIVAAWTNRVTNGRGIAY